MLILIGLSVIKLAGGLSVCFLYNLRGSFAGVFCFTRSWSVSPNVGLKSSRIFSLRVLHVACTFGWYCGAESGISLYVLGGGGVNCIGVPICSFVFGGIGDAGVLVPFWV